MVKNYRISLVLNICIVLLVTIGSIFMFTGFKFMPDETLLEANNLSMFRFYTVDSNILIGIFSLILIVYEIKFVNNKIKNIPNWVYILKYVGTSGIMLTFITTAFFLAPLYGFYAMYNNNNLFFHLMVPVLSIISYIFYEKHSNKYKYAFLGIIPMFVYSIYYTSRILININNGGLTFKYDFYGFSQGDLRNIIIVIPLIYLVSYLVAVLLIFFNKRLSK